MSCVLSRRAFLAAVVLARPAQAQTLVVFAGALTAAIPEGYRAVTSGDVLLVTQIELVRSHLSLDIRVDPDFALHRSWFPNRRGDIRYTIQNIGGEGSGGPRHQLRAQRDLLDGTPMAMRAYQQAERRPDFDVALNLLSSVQRAPS